MHEPSVIYYDNQLAVIHKPIDWPIHKNAHMPKDAPYLIKWAGLYFDCSVYNVHRLDAKTSGLVVVAFNSQTAEKLTRQFAAKQVIKIYYALVRENPGTNGTFNKPVMNKKKGKLVSAITHFSTLETIQTDIAYKAFNAIKISLVKLTPVTGRWHQLRQHLALERNDIIGDNQHGDRQLNHIIEDLTGIKRLYLHAGYLRFSHPSDNQTVQFETALPEVFYQTLTILKVGG